MYWDVICSYLYVDVHVRIGSKGYDWSGDSVFSQISNKYENLTIIDCSCFPKWLLNDNLFTWQMIPVMFRLLNFTNIWFSSNFHIRKYCQHSIQIFLNNRFWAKLLFFYSLLNVWFNVVILTLSQSLADYFDTCCMIFARNQSNWRKGEGNRVKH